MTFFSRKKNDPLRDTPPGSASCEARNGGANDEPVLFISAPQIWSAHVESYLNEKNIPYLKRGKMGAGLALKVGPVNEIFDFYIPKSAVEKANEGLEELKTIIGA